MTIEMNNHQKKDPSSGCILFITLNTGIKKEMTDFKRNKVQYISEKIISITKNQRKFITKSGFNQILKNSMTPTPTFNDDPSFRNK
jgi:hypothetical protein